MGNYLEYVIDTEKPILTVDRTIHSLGRGSWAVQNAETELRSSPPTRTLLSLIVDVM